MALRDLLTFSKAWVSGQGTDTLPAVVTTEANARSNLQIQHSEARDKINEIVAAIATDLDDNDDNHIPTVGAVKAALPQFEQLQSDWNQDDSSAKDFIKNKPAIPAEQVQSDWNQSDSSAKDFIKNKPTIPTVPTISGTSGKMAKFGADNSLGDAMTITISTSDPTGGNDGDIWIKYEA